LSGFFTRRPINLLFPFSVTVSTVAAALLIHTGLTGAAAFEVTGAMLLGTLIALAVIEHWFFVLPLPVTRLWAWALATRAPGAVPAVQDRQRPGRLSVPMGRSLRSRNPRDLERCPVAMPATIPLPRRLS
jgi:hypothetical protein